MNRQPLRRASGTGSAAWRRWGRSSPRGPGRRSRNPGTRSPRSRGCSRIPGRPWSAPRLHRLPGRRGRTRSIGPWRRTLPAKSRTRQFSLPGRAACRGRPSARRAPRLRRAQQRDEIDGRRVEAGGQHAHRGERADLAALKAAMIAIALGLRRVAEDRRGRRCRASRIPRDMARVLDAGAEDQPGFALAPWSTISSTAARVISSRSTAACEVALAMNSPPRVPTPPTSSCVAVCLRHERAEIAVLDQLAHRHLVGDVGEERVLALVQHAAVEPVGRGGEADHLELRD